MFLTLSKFGKRPSATKRAAFHSSPQYNPQKGQFDNRRANLLKTMWQRNVNLRSLFKFLREQRGTAPSYLLPEVKPNFDDFLSSTLDLKVIWFGHSSLLLHLN